jgi:ferredoxin
VDKLVSIYSAECTACLQCVAVCPAEDALALSLPRKRRVPAWAVAVTVAGLFLGFCGWARWTGHWHSYVPDSIYRELIPHANEFTHP